MKVKGVIWKCRMSWHEHMTKGNDPEADKSAGGGHISVRRAAFSSSSVVPARPPGDASSK